MQQDSPQQLSKATDPMQNAFLLLAALRPFRGTLGLGISSRASRRRLDVLLREVLLRVPVQSRSHLVGEGVKALLWPYSGFQRHSCTTPPMMKMHYEPVLQASMLQAAGH